MQVTFLGTGTSHGVPVIACSCAVCASTDPRDKRMRPSVLVTLDSGHNILIDTTPEVRLQLVANRVQRIDAVLYTHDHADHLHGIDDLRRINELLHSAVPIYGSPYTLERIAARFSYIFEHGGAFGYGLPSLESHAIAGPWTLFGQTIVPIPVLHGRMPVLGFRFGRFAYVTDCSTIAPSAMELLTGLHTLVLDALRPEPHPTHFNIEQATAVAQQLAPRQTYFTHLTHNVSHAALDPALAAGIHLAYDGLVLDIPPLT